MGSVETVWNIFSTNAYSCVQSISWSLGGWRCILRICQMVIRTVHPCHMIFDKKWLLFSCGA